MNCPVALARSTYSDPLAVSKQRRSSRPSPLKSPAKVWRVWVALHQLAAAELLGVDPLAVANEGKALLGVAPEALEGLLAALRAHPLGRRAACIGRVVAGDAGAVVLDTGFGARRLFERDADPLTRIC